LAVCKDELICDLAETYHVLHFKELSPEMVATLCFGLRPESRVKMKVSNSKITLTQTLIARMVDELTFQSWAQTKDGQKNRNRPESVLMALTKEPEEEVVSFFTADDFKSAWEKITNGNNDRRGVLTN
jgi:hypothetical protein